MSRRPRPPRAGSTRRETIEDMLALVICGGLALACAVLNVLAEDYLWTVISVAVAAGIVLTVVAARKSRRR